ncbi:MAG: PAS-domain containing protein [Rubrimonas sp.]|uniref:PAS-domain containing protein n=1 Tax=Rubrimonas sp. TaxID=2036015 RepID=UPI002FDECDAC
MIRLSPNGRGTALRFDASSVSPGKLIERLLGALAPNMRLATPPDAPALWFDPQRIRHSTRGARRLLGPVADPGAPLSSLLEAFAAQDRKLSEEPEHALAERLRRLAERGEPFRRRVRLSDGRNYDVEGAPSGPLCVLLIRDVHDECEALERARAAQLRAEGEVALLRAALDRVPVPVWREDEAGAPHWRNAAAEATPQPEAPAEPVRIPGAPGAAFVGRAPPAPAGPDGSLRIYADTVAETFAHLRVGLAIYDANRRLILHNPAMAEIFGAKPEWLANRPSLRETLDRLREARRLPEQADYPAWRAALFTLFDDPAHARYEDVWELPDGRGVHVVGRPHPLGGIAFMFEDFTESMALQRWRSTAVEVRRATLDMLGEGVVVFGSDGQTRIANPACRAIWGLDAPFGPDPAASLPPHVADFAEACARGGDAAATLWRRIRDAVSGGGGRSVWRGRVDLADGRTLDARVAPMPDGSTLAAFTDVTDGVRVAAALRERAEALEAAAAMRDALVDQLSHRLRTPLNAIFGFAQMLHSGRAGPLSPQQAEYLEAVERAAGLLLEGVEHMSELISTHDPQRPVRRPPDLSGPPHEIGACRRRTGAGKA